MSFVNVATVPTGTNSRSVAAADFDGDGDLDLAVTNQNDNNTLILLNNGAGGFVAGTTVASAQAYDVVTGDVNGDGKADLLVTQRIAQRVDVFLGDGAGGFAAAAGSPVLLTGTLFGIATGDFNGDGRLDLVAADYNNNIIHLRLGDGAGDFTTVGGALTIPGGPFVQPFEPAVGDVNGDGALDFVIANESVNTVGLYLGDGSGGFSLTNSFAVGTTPERVALGDLDGDGDLDIVTTNISSDNVSVLLNSGGGAFGAATNFAAGDGAFGLALLDFNNDGRLDIAVTALNADTVALLVGNGSGGFGAPTAVAVGNQPRDLVAVDVNGDGYRDLVTVNQNGNAAGSVNILLATGLDVRALNTALAEGNGANQTFTFQVRRVGSSAGAVSVDWAVTGTGSNPASAADFQGAVLPSGTVNFLAGESVKTVTVTTAADSTIEPSEGFTVTLSNASGGFDIFAATAQAVIGDDDTPPLSLGTSADDVAALGDGSTSYAAGDGADNIFGDGGADTLQGNQGSDTLHGGTGDDLVRGGKDDDQVLGDAGNDLLFGDLGSDLVNGGDGDDRIEGNDGDDQLQGAAGADTLDGGSGADIVRGGQGNDLLFGGDGADFVSGDKGNDELQGGAGADVFHIFAGAGADRVTDFHLSEGDRVMVAAGTSWTVAQSGADTVVTLSDGSTLTLAGVASASLTGGWIFAG